MLLTNEFLVLGVQRFENLTPEMLEKYYTFTDRESYLQWVDNWKHSYDTLSQHIRWAKAAAKSRARGKEIEGEPLLMRFLHPAHVYPVHRLEGKLLARLMLVLRAEGKRRSWELRARRIAPTP